MTIPTSTSLSVRALLKAGLDRLGGATSAAAVDGLTASARALFTAGTARRDAVSLLLVPTDAEVDGMTADTRFFFASLEGLSATEAVRAVLPFPSLEVDPYRGLAPHFEVASARAGALCALLRGDARVVVASAAALLPRMSPPAVMRDASAVLLPGAETSPTLLGDRLLRAGFVRQDPVDLHGEFCVRGGVVDFFPAGEDHPVRLEFIGDAVESIRRYDAATQRSIGAIDQTAVTPVRERLDDDPSSLPNLASVFDYLPASGGRLLTSEPTEVDAQLVTAAERLAIAFDDATARGESPPPLDRIAIGADEVRRQIAGAVRLSALDLDTPEAGGAAHVPCQPAVEFRGRVADWMDDVRRARVSDELVLFVATTSGTAQRTVELLAEGGLPSVVAGGAEPPARAAAVVAVGQLSRGFRLSEAGLQVYAEADVFDEPRRTHERRRPVAQAFLTDFRDLKVGDHVVHVDHGIGVFVGLRQLEVGDDAQEFMELRYAEDAKLFVPVEHLDLIQKYSGGNRPALDRLGGTSWERAKTRVKKAMRDMAEELLKLYAARRTIPGHAFGEDSHWQSEFEDAFEYELTGDQRTAVNDIKRDMEAPVPMDRLLCGDVGYGKTEVALRAAFKAVMEGKQVALLAPTTVLAFQHARTLKERFAAFPVTIDLLSRFRSRAEQKALLEEVGKGKVDITVGTHRLLSKDVVFRDLGLVVVDEEQRFGVAHKERLKQLRQRVDVLTLTATPIPRTLNMSLVGIRDMSVIETPPKDRLAIQTSVVRFDRAVIAQAIRHELARGGQVYVVHNRIESIESIADLVTRLVPNARVAVAHGQLAEDALERCMVGFVEQRFDVLVTTTIVENGLDIPNANTLIINQADHFGLAQLYQLRGRIGRSDRRAYAYFLVPHADALSSIARKRLAAIREFSDLGSGFRVAALDLEIRGAGNLLGGEQSGHIEAIGFEMYVKLLEETVSGLKGEEIADETRAAVNLKVDLRIDEQYVPDMTQRLTVYRRVAGAHTDVDLDQVLSELRDRYGALPASILNLAEYGRIRIRADAMGVESIDRDHDAVVVKFRSEATVDAARVLDVVSARPDVTLIPPGLLKVDLRAATGDGGGRASESWWTSRATTGKVTPGFSRRAVNRRAAENPRAPTGVFARLGGLLAELSAPTDLG
ncbi:MAG: transcription-repair coupling factor [Vicinamibacterales bacterium]|mgnify:CR=1 FL=1|nr:transcription-repair coupling factor [Vicinamibacterales bacterium]MDP6609234.1 transcription-repair coupling factor [Vicinamibacterales bacterium]